MTNTTLDSIRASLDQERDAVVRELKEYGASVEGEAIEVSTDEGFADSAQATAGRSEAISRIEQLHAIYAEITAALDRMDEETYGRCERCGEAIPVERLEAVPTTRLCVTCKQAR